MTIEVGGLHTLGQLKWDQSTHVKWRLLGVRDELRDIGNPALPVDKGAHTTPWEDTGVNQVIFGSSPVNLTNQLKYPAC